ncbi:carbon-nitrogen hydrolase family protein [Pyrobaculum aerophilum]|uniref:Carbon nitrogen hydrolase, conjectural n=3 Tax=Pyrobaculum aerophilum TaxID=13773 RepID=Q8ZTZ2_PYRAE|nr:carbon-nitrogen hydrolase family protein [Pyrobaculum aerophilum]AAL64617.1 carbon nitrogen hydrolase, conjectural [Pyrobaculum aerophilum str. IM2]RFA96671.1 carbon-nitrogen hydrolase family protein [Pyrobaculum aerophilum]HII46134.1 carbon-nitrogen hydrolase family protein [Pyrobaculum aerophilum]
MRVSIAQTRRFGAAAEAVQWLLSRVSPADLLVLPEYWLGVEPLSWEEFEALIRELRRLAEAVGGYVVGGGVAVSLGGEVKNICPVVSPEGLVKWGEKIFPSAATGERLRVSKGRRLTIFNAAGWKVGCLICVDLLYPELARRLALAGAEVIVNPASITADRAPLWKALGLVRAFENSVYVAAALGTGYNYADGRRAEGGSFIASPNGALLDFGAEEGVYTAELDKQEIEYARTRRRYLEDVETPPQVSVD